MDLWIGYFPSRRFHRRSVVWWNVVKMHDAFSSRKKEVEMEEGELYYLTRFTKKGLGVMSPWSKLGPSWYLYPSRPLKKDPWILHFGTKSLFHSIPGLGLLVLEQSKFLKVRLVSRRIYANSIYMSLHRRADLNCNTSTLVGGKSSYKFFSHIYSRVFTKKESRQEYSTW